MNDTPCPPGVSRLLTELSRRLGQQAVAASRGAGGRSPNCTPSTRPYNPIAAAPTGSAVQRGVGELSKTRLSSLSDMFVDVRLAACSLARAEFAHMMGSMKTM